MYIYSNFGADDPCVPCYQQKTVAYAACQALPPGSADRETCFRAADVRLQTCLRGCGGASSGTGLPLLLTAALVAGAVMS